MNCQDIQKKINEYENFIEERLKVDLKDTEIILDDKVTKHKEWQDVQQVVKCVDEFKEKNRDMAVKVDIGGVMASGRITDFERTYVCIGLGYMLEMDCEEANKYSDIRQRLLKREIQHFRKLAVNIKVHIKLVLLAINELQSTIGSTKVKSVDV